MSEELQKSMAQLRSGIILIEDNKVALIQRVNASGTYYLVPGGKVEAGETAEDTVARETREELGLNVHLAALVAIVEFGQAEQYYYLAQVAGGVFGSGTGAELLSPATSPAGTYTPVWLERSRLSEYDVRPGAVAELIAANALSGRSTPLRIRSTMNQPQCHPTSSTLGQCN